MDCIDENEAPVYALVMAEKEKIKDVDEATNVSTQFVRYYYDILEKKPHLAGQLYLEQSVMLWDGNPVCSRDEIQNFIERKLPSLTFNRSSIDCQSMNSVAVGCKKSFIITIAGQYRVSGVGTTSPYTQQMIIIADSDNKWRIATDNFRTSTQK